MTSTEYTYTSTAIRHDGHWLCQCDQFPRVWSGAKLLDTVATMQREALSKELGVPESAITVDVRPELSPAVHDRVCCYEELRDMAVRLNRLAANAHQEVARLLEGDGLSLRDIGTILGVSHQRAHQLIRRSAA